MKHPRSSRIVSGVALAVSICLAFGSGCGAKKRPAYPVPDEYVGQTIAQVIDREGDPTENLEGYHGYGSEGAVTSLPDSVPAGPHKTLLYRHKSGVVYAWFKQDSGEWICFQSIWLPNDWLKGIDAAKKSATTSPSRATE